MKNFKEQLRDAIIKLSNSYTKNNLYYIFIDGKKEGYELIYSEGDILKDTIMYWLNKYNNVKIVSKEYGVYIMNYDIVQFIFYPIKHKMIMLDTFYDKVNSVLDDIMNGINSNHNLNINNIILLLSLCIYNSNCYITIDFKNNNQTIPAPFNNSKYYDIDSFIPKRCLDDKPNLYTKEAVYGTYWYSLSHNIMGFIPKYYPTKMHNKKYVDALHILIKNDISSILRKLKKPSQLKLL